MNWWIDELMNWWIDELMNWWIDELMDSWIHGFMDSWIHGFMDSWIHGFMDSLFYQMIDWLIHSFIDYMIAWIIDWLIGCSTSGRVRVTGGWRSSARTTSICTSASSGSRRSTPLPAANMAAATKPMAVKNCERSLRFESFAAANALKFRGFCLVLGYSYFNGCALFLHISERISFV